MMQTFHRAFLATCLVAAPLAGPACAEDAPDERAIAAQEAAAARRTEHVALHQALGLTTLGGLALSTGLGLAVSNAVLPPEWKLVHVGVASATYGLYLGAAGLALTAPHSPYAVEQPGWSSVAIHENLAWLHATSMLVTVGLGVARFYNVGYPATDWHAAAAFTSLGLLGLSAGVIAFGN